MKPTALFVLFLLSATCAESQNTHEKYASNYEPGSFIITDSSSTLMIPVLYHTSLFSSAQKLATFDNYYANVVFYDFNKDSSRFLFPKETFIRSFQRTNYYADKREIKIKDATAKHIILYLVVRYDHNKNGKIDFRDPSLLYVSDAHGNHLKELTTEQENVVSVEMLPKQNVAMVKLQRDANADGNFKTNDNDYYFRRLDLTTLKLGSPIEVK